MDRPACQPSFKLIAPPHAPLHPDGRLHLDVIDRLAEWLVATGVHGVFLNGSTGESQSLTLAERIKITERWATVRDAGARLWLNVHVGGNCLADCVQLARHAVEVGADAVSTLSPCYFRPQNVIQLVDFCEPIAAAAADVPFYYYDIPGLTGVNLPMVDYLQRGQTRIPNLAGIKYTNPDMLQFQRCLHFENGAYEILFGTDEMLLAGYALGATGAIGSTYNFMAPLYLNMIRDAESGDWEAARQKQFQSAEICRLLHGYGFASASKFVMSTLGFEMGPVRPPQPELTANQKVELFGRLKQFDALASRLAANQPI